MERLQYIDANREELGLLDPANVGQGVILLDCVVPVRELIALNNSVANLSVTVLDRAALLIRIFVASARTGDAKLQASLARELYALEWLQANGGRGSEKGAEGEGDAISVKMYRQLPKDIAQIRKRLTQIDGNHYFMHQRHLELGLPVIVLVGYTNAGKSSLFSRLSGAKEPSGPDRLFRTLDLARRRAALPCGQEYILVDLLGFARVFPPQLLEAFQPTLARIAEADLVLHVADSSSGACIEQVAEVSKILEGVKGFDPTSTPQLLVLNKADQRPADKLPANTQGQGGASSVSCTRSSDGRLSFEEPGADLRLDERLEELRLDLAAPPCYVSARTGSGMDALTEAIKAALGLRSDAQAEEAGALGAAEEEEPEELLGLDAEEEPDGLPRLDIDAEDLRELQLMADEIRDIRREDREEMERTSIGEISDDFYLDEEEIERVDSIVDGMVRVKADEAEDEGEDDEVEGYDDGGPEILPSMFDAFYEEDDGFGDYDEGDYDDGDGGGFQEDWRRPGSAGAFDGDDGPIRFLPSGPPDGRRVGAGPPPFPRSARRR